MQAFLTIHKEQTIMEIFDDASDLIKFQFRYIKIKRGL